MKKKVLLLFVVVVIVIVATLFVAHNSVKTEKASKNIITLTDPPIS